MVGRIRGNGLEMGWKWVGDEMEVLYLERAAVLSLNVREVLGQD